MSKSLMIFLGILALLGIVGFLLPDLAYGWGWGGGGGGGWRPPSERPGGGGGAPGGGPPGGGARPPSNPGAPRPGAGAGPGGGPEEPGEGLTEEQMNQEFEYEFIEEKEADYHRQHMASMFADKD